MASVKLCSKGHLHLGHTSCIQCAKETTEYKDWRIQMSAKDTKKVHTHKEVR